jgi:glutaredoxin 3
MEAVIYTWTFCPFCIRAKHILTRHRIPHVELVMDGKNAELRAIKARYGHPTVPIILLDDDFIGGCEELEALERRGMLNRRHGGRSD